MQQIKRVGVLSVTKMSALFGAVMGILFGFYASVIIPLILASNPEYANLYATPVTGGFQSFIVVLLTYTIMMSLMGLIGAVLYNLFARLVGGIKIDINDKMKKK